jgi:hypothetical protein
MENILNKIDARMLHLQREIEKAETLGSLEGYIAQTSYANQKLGLLKAREFIMEEI